MNLESREVRGGGAAFDFTELWQKKGSGVQSGGCCVRQGLGMGEWKGSCGDQMVEAEGLECPGRDGNLVLLAASGFCNNREISAGLCGGQWGWNLRLVSWLMGPEHQLLFHLNSENWS